MTENNQCPYCNQELKIGKQAIIKALEKELYGTFHKWCYDEIKERMGGPHALSQV